MRYNCTCFRQTILKKILAAGLGIVLGGYLIRRSDLDMVGCAKMATFTSILSICLIIPVFFLKCGSAPIAGVTADYPLGWSF